ncbi:hypothetical protein ACR5KS_03335 [Leucobacter sp. W1153]|uniref:hypothetical protein n=1 Tax=Leucobacter sp. W1153 TaxID=3439064 RepID=UPI003F3D6831
MISVFSARAKIAVLLVFALVAGVGLFSIAPEGADASTPGFNPGNIISDGLFYQGDAMNATEVQNFLNLRVPRCTIGDPGRTAGMAWGSTSIADKCLRDYSVSNTPSRPANSFCGAYPGAANETAAQIIAKVGAACGISQRVLLITLEKEQSLVTDSWPTVRQFDVATGYYCPDSGPGGSANCNPEYFGFLAQVYFAAWQLKVYRVHGDRYNYKPFATNTIQWHPNTSCGTSQVYIENWATAALYIYTPYRPNQAALDAGWGTGDACSSYGNRNFYRFYTNWFGPTTGPDLSPVGSIESVLPGLRQSTISGYAFDPETTAPIQIHYYIGGQYGSGGAWGGSQLANLDNSTVANKYPSYGAAHGFSIRLTGLSAPTAVCIYAINVGRGSTRLLGCPQAAPITGSPTGNFEAFTVVEGKPKARGWVIDPDYVGTVDVHAYSGAPYPQGRWAGSTTTGVARVDVQRVYPEFGSQNGFNFEIPAGRAGEQLCLYAIDKQGAGNTFLGCRVLATEGPPFGNFETARPVFGGVDIAGWAVDPDTKDPISIHVYANGRWAGAYLADQHRPDVGRVHPAFGPLHGFSLQLRGLQPGQNNICVYGIDVFGSSNTQLGCHRVVTTSANPIGTFDSISEGPDQTIVANGWTIDPDTTGPVQVHVYLNDRWYGSYTADQARPDVGAAYPSAGPNHGFSFPIGGRGSYCAYAINIGPGDTNPLLGCRTW